MKLLLELVETSNRLYSVILEIDPSNVQFVDCTK